MALGVDNRLKSSLSSPIAKKTPQYAQRPQMVSQGAYDDVNNNLLAGVAGAGRMAQQQMAGRGISAGRGQQARADMAQSMADVKARQQAAQNNLEAAADNRSRNLAYDTAMRGEQVANQGLLNSLMNAGRSEMLSKQGDAQALAQAAARGRYGLGQIQLDKTPLFQQLLQGMFS